MTPKLIATNRHAETVAFLIGVFALGGHMIADTLLHLGFSLGPCERAHAGVPWAVILGSIVLIVPKTIGRATAGQALLAGLNAITLKLSGRGAATAEVKAVKPDGTSAAIMEAELPEGGGTAVVATPGASEPDPAVDVEIAQAGKAVEKDAEP